MSGNKQLNAIIEADTTFGAMIQIQDEARIPRSFSALISFTGKSLFFFPTMGLGFLLGSNYWRAIIILLGAADFITYFAAHALKRLIRRERPEGEFNPRSRKNDPFSFPSGHAARGGAFALMSMLAAPIPFGIFGLVWGLLIGLSRVRLRMHYPVDILAGWMLGGGIAAFIYFLK